MQPHCHQVLDEIERWLDRDPNAGALPFLLSGDALAAVRASHGVDDEQFEAASTRHRAAVDRHLAPILLRIVEGGPPSPDELDALVTASAGDPVSSAFATEAASPTEEVAERIRLLPGLWVRFAGWWRSYFSEQAGPPPPITDLWRLYLPLGQWIVREKRRVRPGELFMVGFNGSPGAGKTVLTNALAVLLDHLLDSETEGSAVARSGDDWYLGKADRELLRSRGYDPGRPGVSNRALPGTHELDWLTRNLREMTTSTPHSVIRMGNFDKKADDQPAGADRYFEVRGKVGVFLFDLWFAGAETDIDPMQLPDGLQRRVAEQLREWRPVFERMDALWAFDWPPREAMLREREAQERLVEQRRGGRGMSQQDLGAFMDYMIERAWDWQLTSPVPPAAAVTFRCWRDTHHRVIAVRSQGGAS
ncbi:MAG: kinase-like protein [Jatrophihabitans sp.]